MEKLLYFCSSVLSSLITTGKAVPVLPKRILMVKLDEIGDVIYTLHCFEALCSRYPDAEIVLWCKPMNNVLVKQFPQINVVNQASDVRGKFDIQIDFRGNWKSLTWPLLGKSSYYLERGSTRLYNKFNGGQLHETQTNQQILRPIFGEDFDWPEPTLSAANKDVKAVDELLDDLNVNQFVLLHAGARSADRRWPVDRFRTLATEIHKTYELPVLFIGAQNEFDINQEITNGLNFAHNLAGKTSLTQLSELTRRCQFFVGNESGPMHFAVINKTPLVALFGPGVKDVFYPLYENQQVIHHLDKQPAQVTDITVEEVLETIKHVYPQP